MFLLIVNSTNKLKQVMFLMVVLSCIIAGQAISQYYSGEMGLAGQDFYHSGTGIRTKWVGLWNGANIMALLLNISLPFALEFTFGPYSKFHRLVNALFSGCLIIGVYTTNSRGGFVTMLAILVMYPLIRIKNIKAIILSIILATVMVVYLAPSRIGELNTQEESANIRTRLWGNAFDMFKENPLLGVGKGKFAENTSRNLVAHSNFMQNLGEIGGLGIFVWVGLIYFSFKSLLSVYNMRIEGNNQNDRGKLNSLSRALLVSLIGFNICTLFITMEIDIFYLLLGLCAACINIAQSEYKLIELKFTFKDFRNIIGVIIIMMAYYHIYTR